MFLHQCFDFVIFGGFDPVALIMQPGHLIKQPYNFSLFDPDMLSELFDRGGELYTNLDVIGLFFAIADVDLHFESIHHLTEGRILVQQVRVMFEHGFELDLELVDKAVVQFGVLALLVELGGAYGGAVLGQVGLVDVLLPVVGVCLFSMQVAGVCSPVRTECHLIYY